MKRINGVGVAGIIILIITSLFPIIYGIYLIDGFDKLKNLGVFTFSHTIIRVLVVIPFIFSWLILILSIVTLIFRIKFIMRLLGIIGILNAFFVWIFFIFPLVFSFIGGVLTYCGVIRKKVI